mmetsp:Transcript_20730/g.40029  ORF Transcript_20730/g.40029 Transcript_20730/m.40029 type:complete len:327 (-) Transcript_20730:1216-2196(-)
MVKHGEGGRQPRVHRVDAVVLLLHFLLGELLARDFLELYLFQCPSVIKVVEAQLPVSPFSTRVHDAIPVILSPLARRVTSVGSLSRMVDKHHHVLRTQGNLKAPSVVVWIDLHRWDLHLELLWRIQDFEFLAKAELALRPIAPHEDVRESRVSFLWLIRHRSTKVPSSAHRSHCFALQQLYESWLGLELTVPKAKLAQVVAPPCEDISTTAYSDRVVVTTAYMLDARLMGDALRRVEISSHGHQHANWLERTLVWPCSHLPVLVASPRHEVSCIGVPRSSKPCDGVLGTACHLHHISLLLFGDLLLAALEAHDLFRVQTWDLVGFV